MANILSTKQAAEILGIKPLSVAKQINRGKLKAVKFGNSWMLELSEVERYQQEVQRTKK